MFLLRTQAHQVPNQDFIVLKERSKVKYFSSHLLLAFNFHYNKGCVDSATARATMRMIAIHSGLSQAKLFHEKL